MKEMEERESQASIVPPHLASSESLNVRPAIAGAYYCQDFEWELLRDEVERGGFSQALDSNKEVEAMQMSTKEAWTKFHERHLKGDFFKERRYLVKEFPELLVSDKMLRVLEVGCGTGSSVLPVLRVNSHATVYACDCSKVALEKIQELANAIDPPDLGKHRFFPFYCDICTHAFPAWLCCDLCRQSFLISPKTSKYKLQDCDISTENFSGFTNVSQNDPEIGELDFTVISVNPIVSMLDEKGPEMLPQLRQSLVFVLPEPSCCLGGVNIIMMVFTLSSVPPEKMQHVIKECYSVLEPGGLLLFRDYGLYDMTMLRFPDTQRIGKYLYRRNDGTLSFFFTPEILRELATREGFVEEEIQLCCVQLMNHRKSLPMKRVWIHAKFSKPKR